MSTRSTTWTLVAALAAVAAPALPAQEFFVGGGASLYESSEYCLDSESTISDYHVGVGWDSWGASIAYDDGDWPWPKPPGGGSGTGNQLGYGSTVIAQQQEGTVFLSRGSSFQLVGEVYPLAALPVLREATASLRRYVKPFVGVGIQVSDDGEASTERAFPTYAVKGGTDPVIAYGASLRVPVAGPIGLQLQLRGTSLFSGDVEFEGPSGERVSTDGETLTWWTWLVGFSVGL